MKRKLAAVVVLALTAVGLHTLLAQGQPLPVPNPLVVVDTNVDGIKRAHLVPIGGLPTPLDVDNKLGPDIDVAIGLLSLTDLPNSPIVPSITVQRNALATTLGTPAPNLQINAKVRIYDLLSILNLQLPPNLDLLAAVDYGFRTPAGATMPPRVVAKLTGPILQGFVDPLEARIETPGYNGALEFNVHAVTKTTDANFKLAFDALPERIHFIEDPYDGGKGLDFTYDHVGTNPDVKLTATATLKNLTENTEKRIDATVERLPANLKFIQTVDGANTKVDYSYSSPTGAPDVEARYRAYENTDVLKTDAKLRFGALPSAMHAEVLQGADNTIKSVAVNALGDGEIGVVEIDARNHEGQKVPALAPRTGPRQQLTAVTRRGPDGEPLWLATGRIEHVRSVAFARTGELEDGIDLTTDLGDGQQPLRAAFDLDDRGPGAEEGARRIKVDSTVRPLPQKIHVKYDAAAGDAPLKLHYDPSSATDVEADALVATGLNNTCGVALVTCAKAVIEGLPSSFLDLSLPTQGKGTDYSLDHAGPQTPDVRATVRSVPELAKDRRYAEIAIQDVPNSVRARVVSVGEDVRTAEFHACAFDWVTRECPKFGPITLEGVLSRVDFLVRDVPDRGDLPTRPDAEPQHVTIVKRGSRTEAVGRVDAVRELVYRKRAGENGTIGLRVRAGGEKHLDVVADLDDPVKDKRTVARVAVGKLPDDFGACVRTATILPSPNDPATDDVFKGCESQQIANEPDPDDNDDAGDDPVVVRYNASAKTNVTADVDITKPDEDDAAKQQRLRLRTTVQQVPDFMRAVIQPPADAENGDLHVAYDASDELPLVNVDVRKTTDDAVCDDPRAGKEALCASARLAKVPKLLRLDYVKEAGSRDLRLQTTPKFQAADRMDLEFLRLTTVGDGDRVGVTGFLEAVPQRVKAELLEIGEGEDKELGRVRVDACPAENFADSPDPDAAECAGVKRVGLQFTKSPDGGTVPPSLGPPLTAEQPETDSFSLRGRGDALTATAQVRSVRTLEFSKVHPVTKIKSPVTRAELHAGLDALELDVDRIGKDGSQRVKARIDDLPQGIGLCFRKALENSEGGLDDITTPLDNNGFCGRQPHRFTAIQVGLTSTDTERPDVDLKTLRITAPGGKTYSAKAFIRDLAERIDVKAATNPDTEVSVEGHGINDGDDAPAKAVAERMDFDVQTFDGSFGKAFPGKPLGGAVEPDVDPGRVTDEDGDKNLLKVQSGGTGRLRVIGSLPDVRRIALLPQPCAANNDATKRHPAMADFQDASLAPDYKCLETDAARGRPLGIAVRLLKDGDVTAIEEGFISKMPDGLSVSIAKSPELAGGLPACSVKNPAPCRPPALSVTAPGRGARILEARLTTGPLDDVADFSGLQPTDEFSRQTPFEQPPRQWADGDGIDDTDDELGARVKLNNRPGAQLVRAGLRLALPQFLDLDQPAALKCAQECDDRDYADVAVKLVASNEKRLGTELTDIGRMAFWMHDPSDLKAAKAAGDSVNDLVLVGTPPTEGLSDKDPESSPDASSERLGFKLPGYFDARFYLRKDNSAGGKFDDPVDPAYTRLMVQLDSRSNAELNLGARLDDRVTTVQNREHAVVADKSFALRNIVGDYVPPANPLTDPDEPSFRLRAIVDVERTIGAGNKPSPCRSPDVPKYLKGVGASRAIFIGCLFGPKIVTGWLDVQLDGSKIGDGNRVRRLDATVERILGQNQVQVLGHDSVNGGDPAKFTAHGGIAFPDFEFATEVNVLGVGSVILANLNVIARFEMLGVTKARVAQRKSSVRGGAKEGRVRIIPDVKGEIRETAYIFGGSDYQGLVAGRYYHNYSKLDVNFLYCRTVTYGHFGDDTGALDTTSYGTDEEAEGFLNFPDVSMKHRLGLAVDLLFCPAKHSKWAEWQAPKFDKDLDEPRPSFEIPGRAVPGSPDSAPTKEPLPADDEATPEHVEISGDKVACGSVTGKTITVKAGANLRVGRQGEEIDGEIMPGYPIDEECDGRLELIADKITIEQNATIDADAVTTSGPGTAPQNSGGGAGGHTNGGASGGGGAGGDSHGLDSEYGLDNTFGTPGARGGAGESGGRGGGIIVLRALRSLVVNGTLTARGGTGADAVAVANCDASAAGGGSGGTIHLDARRGGVGDTGVLDVSGGRGGNASVRAGGGGGSAGRIRLDVIDLYANDGARERNAGGGGDATGECDDGKAPGGGGPSTVTGLTRYAVVEGINPSDTNIIGDGIDEDNDVQVNLRVRAYQRGGGHLSMIFCKRSLPLGSGNSIGSPELNWDGGDGGNVFEGAECEWEGIITEPNADGEYIWQVDYYNKLGEGFHGFYAYVGKPVAENGDCRFPGRCETQQAPPAGSFRLAVDVNGPQITWQALEGVECDEDRRCVGPDSQEAEIAVDATDDQSEVASIDCIIDGDVVVANDCRGERVSVPLTGPPNDSQPIQIRARDAAGNETWEVAGKWVVDTIAPTLKLVQSNIPAETNGWLDAAPRFMVFTDDPMPGAGVDLEQQKLVLDGEAIDLPCENCTNEDMALLVPPSGSHSIQATAADRVGNRSAATQVESFKVDADDPVVSLRLGPAAPDGLDGWYRESPRIGFGVDDGDGSGVDLSKEPSRLRYRLDDGPWKLWSQNGNHVIPAGIHTVCWDATDIAGNESDVKCSGEINVDGVLPEPKLDITPDGSPEWFTVKPTAKRSGTDGGGSGLDLVQIQTDGGDWSEAQDVVLGEGRHEVRVRAFDHAGNRAVTDRVLQVDTKAPKAELTAWPPAPNLLGWHRTAPQRAVSGLDDLGASRVNGGSLRVDADAPVDAEITREVSSTDGAHSFGGRVTDRAGLTSSEAVGAVKVDTAAAASAVTGLPPLPILLPGQTSTLRFAAGGTGTPNVKVRVIVLSTLSGQPVRTLHANGGNWMPAGQGQVVWDGTHGNGDGVLPGTYVYRVHVTDEAGNTGYSTESKPLLVGLAPKPDILGGLGGLLGGVLQGTGLL